MKNVTTYKGISKFYFNYLLFEIIKIASLDSRDIKVLDFGCGKNQLKKILGKKLSALTSSRSLVMFPTGEL